MAVTDQNTYFSYTGDGSIVTFPYLCQLLQSSDLTVKVNSVVMANGTDYSVTGVGVPAGGSVVFAVAPAAGAVVEIERIMEFNRATTFQTAGDFKAEVVNNDLDRLSMICQQLKTWVQRCFKAPVGQEVETIDATEYANRAGKVLGYNSLGKLALMAVNYVTSSGLFTNPWADVRGYTDLAAAVAALGGTSIELIVPNGQAVTANLTIPTNIQLTIKMGGGITISAGKTLTINGSFNAVTTSQIFFGSGTVEGLSTAYPEWWGAGDEAVVADSTAAITNAINCILANDRGGVVNLSNVVYSITSVPIASQNSEGTCYLTIKGMGTGASYFRMNSTTGNVFEIQGSRYITFQDFSMTPTSSPRTAGAAFYAGLGGVGGTTPSSTITWRRITISTAYNGIHLYKCGGCILEEVQGTDFSTHAWNSFIINEGNSGASEWRRVIFGTANTPTGPGFDLKVAGDATAFDTISMYDSGVQKLGNAVIPVGLKAAGGEFLHVKNCFFEVGSNGGIGIWLAGANNVSITDTHAVTSQYGIKITDGNNIHISKGRLYHNGRSGLRIEGGRLINVEGVSITDNGYGDPTGGGTIPGTQTNVYDAVYIGAGVSDYSITNNTIGKIRADGYQHRYGIYLEDSKADNFVIEGNNISDYGSGSVYNGAKIGAAQDFNKKINNNTGQIEAYPPIHAGVRTTDATPTALWTRTLVDKQTYYVTAKVIVQYSGGGGATGTFTRSVLAYRDGAGAVIIGSVVDGGTIRYDASLSCTFVVSGNNLILHVTNTAGSTFDWYASVETITVVDATTWGALP